MRRPRRLRRTPAIRALVCETRLNPEQLILPQFVVDGQNVTEPIEAIPGRSRQSIDRMLRECEEAIPLGVRAFALFPAVDASAKSPDAAEAVREGNLLCRAVRAAKSEFGEEVCIITDVALDPYSSHGHDGLVDTSRGVVLNDETVEMLTRMAVMHAEAGADFVAPSDMMDGRGGAIRDALDSAGFIDTGIISYSAKYASAFYGPFRQALDSAPVNDAGVPGNKKTYQMDPANVREAMVEAALDAEEGADVLMVKPATPYLDVIAALRERTDLPIAAYHVSGEYAMIKAAAANGWIDERDAMMEALLAIRRAGADMIFTYAALDFARWNSTL